MESKASLETIFLPSWDSFPSYVLKYPDLFHDLVDVHAALSADLDLIIPSDTPNLTDWLIDPVPAVLDAAGAVIIPPVPGIPKYTMLAGGGMNAASLKEFSSDKRDLIRTNKILATQSATAMARAIKSFSTGGSLTFT